MNNLGEVKMYKDGAYVQTTNGQKKLRKDNCKIKMTRSGFTIADLVGNVLTKAYSSSYAFALFLKQNKIEVMNLSILGEEYRLIVQGYIPGSAIAKQNM